MVSSTWPRSRSRRAGGGTPGAERDSRFAPRRPPRGIDAAVQRRAKLRFCPRAAPRAWPSHPLLPGSHPTRTPMKNNPTTRRQFTFAGTAAPSARPSAACPRARHRRRGAHARRDATATVNAFAGNADYAALPGCWARPRRCSSIPRIVEGGSSSAVPEDPACCWCDPKTGAFHGPAFYTWRREHRLPGRRPSGRGHHARQQRLTR